jgi:hypothetical protein
MSAEDTMFRGHADDRWEIKPSAYRKDARGITSDFHLGMWKDIAIRFTQPRPANDLEWLVLAQHHGIATNLLDWTSNPLNALLFACLSLAESPPNGEVIAINRNFFTEDDNKVLADPFLREEYDAILIDASSMNARSMAQDSFMSVHPADSPEVTLADYQIERFEVPASLKAPILSALECLGVSEQRLYTDLGAVASVFKRRMAALDDVYVNVLEAARRADRERRSS